MPTQVTNTFYYGRQYKWPRDKGWYTRTGRLWLRKIHLSGKWLASRAYRTHSRELLLISSLIHICTFVRTLKNVRHMYGNGDERFDCFKTRFCTGFLMLSLNALKLLRAKMSIWIYYLLKETRYYSHYIYSKLKLCIKKCRTFVVFARHYIKHSTPDKRRRFL